MTLNWECVASSWLYAAWLEAPQLPQAMVLALWCGAGCSSVFRTSQASLSDATDNDMSHDTGSLHAIVETRALCCAQIMSGGAPGPMSNN